MSEPYPFTRILVPFDGSPGARLALEWAAVLAKAGGDSVALITLLRVVGGAYLARHLHNVDLRVTRMDQVATWRRMRQHHLDHQILPLLEEGRHFLREKGVAAAIDTRVADGKVGGEILRLAGEGGYNAIVMGRRGLSPVRGLFLGSVTRQVLLSAQKMTIFVAGPDVVFKPDCPVSPLLLPVDGSEPSRAAVRQGAALAQRFAGCQPQFTLLHVVDFVKVSGALNAGTTFLVKEGEDILAAGRGILQEAGLEGPESDKLLVGDPSRIIAAEAAEGQYALVLMGARGLSSLKQLLLGSVSKEVVHRVSRAMVGIVYL
jgi:nucleotide-binding universal stress UspA family protein